MERVRKRLRVVGYLNNVTKIVLAKLVTSREGSKQYEHIATRVYDIETGETTDEALEGSAGEKAAITRAYTHCGVLSEVPQLDIRTKQLVGKNKDKYCTLLSIRAFLLPDTYEDAALRRVMVSWLGEMESFHYETLAVHILGYTFIDINGDKRYYTLAQLRKSDIMQHAHSTRMVDSMGRVYGRMAIGLRKVLSPVDTMLELSDIDTSLDDEEIGQANLIKNLVGGYCEINPDGFIQVDDNEIKRRQPEELEIPEGVLHIPKCALQGYDSIKRIKLPESLLSIGVRGISRLSNLEDVNIPSRVKELYGVFVDCHCLNRLDLSGLECATLGLMTVKHLILPDLLYKAANKRRIDVGVLEFRSVTNAGQRVLEVKEGKHEETGVWRVGRIETNGPVVLGNYRVDINCVDASALEPNIVGIAPDSSFHKVDVGGNPLPWELGPTTRFVCAVDKGGYKVTDSAYAANKLKVAAVNKRLDTVLPKSVEILQGCLSRPMLEFIYPNVTHVTLGLCGTLNESEGASVVDKFPALRWLLPIDTVLMESQIKRREKKLSAMLSEVCEYTRSEFGMDLRDVRTLSQLKRELLCIRYTPECCAVLFKRYGMIYVGDYNNV